MSRRTADPATLRSGREFVAFAERAGCRIRQNGSHVIATADNGQSCVIPMHRGELPTGTRRSILRMLARMGLLAAAVLGALALWAGVEFQYTLFQLGRGSHVTNYSRSNRWQGSEGGPAEAGRYAHAHPGQ